MGMTHGVKVQYFAPLRRTLAAVSALGPIRSSRVSNAPIGDTLALALHECQPFSRLWLALSPREC